MSAAVLPPGARRIVSRDNPFYRGAVQLVQSARERKRERASFIEGVHLCTAFRARHGAPRRAFLTEPALADPEVRAAIDALGDRVAVIPAPMFAALSQVAEGVQLGFVIDTPEPALPDRIDDDCVYLDRLQDPGNVGTIVRTCAATGVRRVVTAPDTAFCWSPKVLRAAMGAHFHLDIHEGVDWEVLRPRLAVPCTVARADAPISLWQADLAGPRLWVFGNEGAGISASVALTADLALAIPQSSAVESLNVAIAAAVCLFEQARQRSVGKGEHRAVTGVASG